MSSKKAPSVAKQSSSLAGRIKPIFPSSRRWSSTGRENYRIYPRKSPFQTGLEWVTERSRRTSCIGLAVFAALFSFASGIVVLLRTTAKTNLFLLSRTTQYWNWLLGLSAHLIPHHRLIQHSLIRRPSMHLAWPGRPPNMVYKTGISYHQQKTPSFRFFFLLA
jgi:hypothetical protein